MACAQGQTIELDDRGLCERGTLASFVLSGARSWVGASAIHSMQIIWQPRGQYVRKCPDNCRNSSVAHTNVTYVSANRRQTSFPRHSSCSVHVECNDGHRVRSAHKSVAAAHAFGTR